MLSKKLWTARSRIQQGNHSKSTNFQRDTDQGRRFSKGKHWPWLESGLIFRLSKFISCTRLLSSVDWTNLHCILGKLPKWKNIFKNSTFTGIPHRDYSTNSMTRNHLSRIFLMNIIYFSCGNNIFQPMIWFPLLKREEMRRERPRLKLH